MVPAVITGRFVTQLQNPQRRDDGFFDILILHRATLSRPMCDLLVFCFVSNSLKWSLHGLSLFCLCFLPFARGGLKDSSQWPHSEKWDKTGPVPGVGELEMGLSGVFLRDRGSYKKILVHNLLGLGQLQEGRRNFILLQELGDGEVQKPTPLKRLTQYGSHFSPSR